MSGSGARQPTRAAAALAAERRKQLLDSGVELLGQRGLAEVSVEEIAADAGVAKGLLYHYFASKNEFVVAVLERGQGELAQCLAPDCSLPRGERLEASLDAFFNCLELRPSAFASMSGGGESNPKIAAVIAKGRRGQVASLMATLAHCEPPPALSTTGPALETALQGWLFFCEGVMPRWLEQGDLEREQLRTLLRRALDAALLAASAVSRPGASA